MKGYGPRLATEVGIRREGDPIGVVGTSRATSRG